MLDYEIVPIEQAPKFIRGKWLKFFNDLPFDKAVKFSLPSKSAASHKGISILGSLRAARITSFEGHFRIIPDGDKWLLYVWKEHK